MGVVAHVYNSSILKVKTGVFGVEFIFSYKFKASLGYETLSLKKQSKTNKQKYKKLLAKKKAGNKYQRLTRGWGWGKTTETG